MTENQLAKIIVNECYTIHTELGPGLFESVYEKVLAHQLIMQGIKIKIQKGIPLVWKGINLEMGFRADIIVDEKLIIEVKSIERIAPVHYKQLLTYLKLTDIKLGLLVNFNENLIKNGITRIVNNL